MEGKNVLNRRHIGAILAALSTFIIQLIFNSLVIGGLVGLLIMVVTGCFKYSELDETINSGIAMIGWISFIMLAASGFSEVIVATHGIEKFGCSFCKCAVCIEIYSVRRADSDWFHYRYGNRNLLRNRSHPLCHLCAYVYDTWLYCPGHGESDRGGGSGW